MTGATGDSVANFALGKKILIVEDEALLAMDLEATLEDNGFRVLGMAGSVAAALQALERERPDAVTLDMNLNGMSSAPVASYLRDAAIPFLVISGYGDQYARPAAYADAPLIKKPFRPMDVIARLNYLAAQVPD